MVRDIPREAIDRVMQQENYSRWTYFADPEAGQAGIIFANDTSLALYGPDDDSALKLGPSGVMELESVRYVPSSHQLYIERSGDYLTLQVFSDPDQAGRDRTTAQQWQQFLAEHSVAKLTAPAAASAAPSGGHRKLVTVVAAVASVAVIASVVVSLL